MKIKNIIFRKSVFNKIIFGFLFIAIPLYTVSLVTIWYVSDNISRETLKSMEEKLYFFTGYIEDELSNINQMLVVLNISQDLRDFYETKQKRDYFQSFMRFNALINKLKGIQLSSNYISDVFMIFPDTGEEISVNHGYRGVDKEREAVTKLPYGDHGIPQLHSYVNDNFIVYFIENENDYVLGIEVFQKKITEAVKKYQLNHNFKAFLVDAKTGKLIGGDALTEVDKKIFNTGVLHGTTTVEHERFIVQSLTSKDKSFVITTYALERELLSNFYVFRKFALIFLLVSVLVFLSIAFLIDKQVKKPLKLLVNYMREVEIGNYDVILNYNKDDEFGFVYKQFNRMSSKLNTLISEVLEKKIQIQKSELKQLQSHINPHFLFNCLYIGYRMAKSGDNENVAMLCKYLGDYFRFITYFSNSEVCLKDELNYTITYLNIQKLRYSNKLDFRIHVNVDQQSTIVPSLIIQPLVENSIRHGIEKINRPGLIMIDINRVQGKLIIAVTDNGPGMEEDEINILQNHIRNSSDNQNHYGLWNIHWRLKYLYDKEGCLEISNVEVGGLKVSYNIPYKEVEAAKQKV